VYTVTCPSCGYAIELRFARRRAAGRCPSCAKVLPVDDATLRVSGSAAPSSPPPTPRIDPETPRLDEDGNVIGLSGLSHLLKQSAPVKPRPSHPPNDATLTPPGKRQPLHPAAVPRQGLILAVVGVAIVALIGLAIWYITLPQRAPAPQSNPPAVEAHQQP